MEDTCENYYLELSSSVVKFDSVSKATNVFFDDTNKQVFAVRSGGVMGVVVKGFTPSTSTDFRMEDKGPVFSIKFSPDQKVLAVQRTKSSVEFINFLSGMDATEYSQSCKGKNHSILGFLWTQNREIFFVTDHGAELFQVIPEKRTLKQLKTFSLPVNWFVYCPQTHLILLSSGVIGNQMQPLHIKQGNINKLSRFDIDLPITPNPPKLCLLERDITLGVLYGETSIIVLRHNVRGAAGSYGAEVVIYTVMKMMTAKKTHVLRLDLTGRFAVNVVDNIIIVHHQASKKSLIFDIALKGESDGSVSYHQPLIGLHPIKPFTLSLPALPSQMLTEPTQIPCELYSANWVVFQPNIIIDAKLGCLWTVEINLQPLLKVISDKVILVDFLKKRTNAKPVVIQVLQDILQPESRDNKSLIVISEIFNHLNEVYRSFLEMELQNHMGTPASLGSLPSASQAPPSLSKNCVVIDQSDMYTNVFSRFINQPKNESEIIDKFEVWVLLEYIRSLTDYHIPVQHFLHELLINSLVQHKAYYQLHQLLQYHVVSDSKPLACLLLSLENLYPAAHQLALDMLKRLSTANEEIIEVLLSKQQILPALRFVHSVGSVDQISARKFLDAAKSTGDSAVFCSVFTFFEQRNFRLKGNYGFAKGEHCDMYRKHYLSICTTHINSNGE